MNKRLIIIATLLLPICLYSQTLFNHIETVNKIRHILNQSSFEIKLPKSKLVFIKVNNSFANLKRVDTTELEREPLKWVEQFADKNARKVLETGRLMALEQKSILPGSCWTYINAVYNRAGFKEDRYYVFKSKKKGPYANTDSIKSGDWLYYVNHSYRNIDHSGIFVHWVDKEKQIALILSYPGRYKKKPGNYKKYKIDNVFFITRPGVKTEKFPTLSASLDDCKKSKCRKKF